MLPPLPKQTFRDHPRGGPENCCVISRVSQSFTGRSRALILAASMALSALSPAMSKAGVRAADVQTMKAQAISATTMSAAAMGILARAASGSVQCQIRKNESPNGVELVGVVISASAVAGNASFTILKSGTAGTSNIRQANHFAVDAGKEAIIGRAKIGLEHGALVTADLSVKSDDGLECRVTAPLEH